MTKVASELFRTFALIVLSLCALTYALAQSSDLKEAVISWDRLEGMSAVLRGESNDASLISVVPAARNDLIELSFLNGSVQPDVLEYVHSSFVELNEICVGDYYETGTNTLSCAVALVRAKHKADVAAFKQEPNNRCSKEETVCFIEQAVMAERWLVQNWGRLSDRNLMKALSGCGSVRTPFDASLACFQAVESARLDDLDRFEDTMYRFMAATVQRSASELASEVLRYSEDFEYLSYIENVFRSLESPPRLETTIEEKTTKTSLDPPFSTVPDGSEGYVMSVMERRTLDRLGDFKNAEMKWRVAFSKDLQRVINLLNESMIGKAAFQEIEACQASGLTRIARTRRNYADATEKQKDCLVGLPNALGRQLEKVVREFENDYKVGLASSVFCGNNRVCAREMRNRCERSKLTSSQTPIELILLPTRGQPASYLSVDPFSENLNQKENVQLRHAGEIWVYNLLDGACVPTGISIAENASRELRIETGDTNLLLNAMSLPDWSKQTAAGECARQVEGRFGICWNNLSISADANSLRGSSYPNVINVTGDLHINFKMPLFESNKWHHFDLVVSSGQSESVRTQFNNQLTDYIEIWRQSLSRGLKDFGRQRGLTLELVEKDHSFCTPTLPNFNSQSASAFVSVVVDVAIKIPNMKMGLCGTFGLSETGQPNFTWSKPSSAFQSELMEALARRISLDPETFESERNISIISVRYPDVFAGDRDLIELDLQIGVSPSVVKQIESCDGAEDNVKFTLFINTTKGLRLDGIPNTLKQQAEIVARCLESQIKDEVTQRFANAFDATDELLDQLKDKGWEISEKGGSYQVCIPIDVPSTDENDRLYAMRKIVMRAGSNTDDPDFDLSAVEMIKSRSSRSRCRGPVIDLDRVQVLLNAPIKGDNVEFLRANSASGLSYDAHLNVPRLGWIILGRANIKLDKFDGLGFKFEQSGSLQQEILKRVLSDPLAGQGLKNIANGLGFKSLCSSMPTPQFPKETDECKIPAGRHGVFMGRNMEFLIGLDISCTMPLISVEEANSNVRVDVLASSADDIHCDADPLKDALLGKLARFLSSDASGNELVEIVCTPGSVNERECPGFSSDDFVALRLNLSDLSTKTMASFGNAKVELSDIVVTPRRLLKPGGVTLILPEQGYVNLGQFALIDTAVTLSFGQLDVIRADGSLTIEGGGSEGTKTAAKAIRFDVSALIDLEDSRMDTTGKLVVADSTTFAQTESSLWLRRGVFGFSGKTIGDLAKVVPADIRGCLVANNSNVFTGLSANLKVLELSEANANILLIGRTEGEINSKETLGFNTVAGCNSLPAFKHLRRAGLILFAEMENTIVDVSDVLVRIEAKRRPSDSSAAARFGFLEVANLGIDLNPQRAKATLEVLGLAISIVTPDITGLSRDELERIIVSIIQPELPSIEQFKNLLQEKNVTIRVAPLTWESGSEQVSFSNSEDGEWSKDDIVNQRGEPRNVDAGQDNTDVNQRDIEYNKIAKPVQRHAPPIDDHVLVEDSLLSAIYKGSGGKNCSKVIDKEIENDIRKGVQRIWSGGDCLSIYRTKSEGDWVVKAAHAPSRTGGPEGFRPIDIDWQLGSNDDHALPALFSGLAPDDPNAIMFFTNCLLFLSANDPAYSPLLKLLKGSVDNRRNLNVVTCEKGNNKLSALLVSNDEKFATGYLYDISEPVLAPASDGGVCSNLPINRLRSPISPSDNTDPTQLNPPSHYWQEQCLFRIIRDDRSFDLVFESVFRLNAERQVPLNFWDWVLSDTFGRANLHLGQDFFLRFGAAKNVHEESDNRLLVLHPCVGVVSSQATEIACEPIIIQSEHWHGIMALFWNAYAKDNDIVYHQLSFEIPSENNCNALSKPSDCTTDRYFEPFFAINSRPDPWRLLQIIRHQQDIE